MFEAFPLILSRRIVEEREEILGCVRERSVADIMEQGSEMDENPIATQSFVGINELRPKELTRPADGRFIKLVRHVVRVITIIDIALITIIDGSFRARSEYRWPLLCFPRIG
jgi:hypothetical protein